MCIVLDLTAAFDMLRLGLLLDRINGILPFQLCRIVSSMIEVLELKLVALTQVKNP